MCCLSTTSPLPLLTVLDPPVWVLKCNSIQVQACLNCHSWTCHYHDHHHDERKKIIFGCYLFCHNFLLVQKNICDLIESLYSCRNCRIVIAIVIVNFIVIVCRLHAFTRPQHTQDPVSTFLVLPGLEKGFILDVITRGAVNNHFPVYWAIFGMVTTKRTNNQTTS